MTLVYLAGVVGNAGKTSTAACSGADVWRGKLPVKVVAAICVGSASGDLFACGGVGIRYRDVTNSGSGTSYF